LFEMRKFGTPQTTRLKLRWFETLPNKKRKKKQKRKTSYSFEKVFFLDYGRGFETFTNAKRQKKNKKTKQKREKKNICEIMSSANNFLDSVCKSGVFGEPRFRQMAIRVIDNLAPHAENYSENQICRKKVVSLGLRFLYVFSIDACG